MNKLAHFLLRALAGFPREAKASPSYYPTGVTFYDPEKAWNGGPSGYGMPNEMAPVTGYHTAVRPSSCVVEFDPVAKKIVWEYDWYKNHKGLLGHMVSKFYSPFISCAQRLPNGNTVITEGDMGASSR